MDGSDIGMLLRSWSGNANAIQAIQRAMSADPRLKVTLPNPVDEAAFWTIENGKHFI